jgi:transaldolase
VYYVEALIAPQTVNTLPHATLEAYRDHGKPAIRISEQLDEAKQTLATLKKLGIDMNAVSDQLEREGVKKFNEPFDALHAMLQKRLAETRKAS